ncbi:TIGR02679 family protein [Amycolatopsis magusensis]|uniref:TIGR02679 family protein n=1 Tax=Amycolatopsis magusensis TaxID=882444 RepID=UPI0024A8AC1B|nr:TIGR02679 family protein [Amycolatopsis magusensis]MDI5975269.1 TIGR02679 family protein [Amycolatopsis magusensis]
MNFRPELTPLWHAVHTRLSSGLPVSRVRVGPLDADQQAAIADLLGLEKLPGPHADISLPRLQEAVQEATGQDLRTVLTDLRGPIGDRAAERRKAADERAELRTWLATHPVVEAQPALADWAATIRADKQELEKALEVLARLPAAGVPLPVFAENVLGETHALDDGRRLTGLVQKALTAIYDLPQPQNAQDRRTIWERAGIADDELSSTVLATGFRTTGQDVANRILRACADAGQAAVLTLQQLRKSEIEPPQDVWIFENPSVLALALDRFGDRCPPMVCTSGWPSSAGILLLRQLAKANRHYHGDFDGEGLRIAANVIARTGARPWQMTSDDYLAAAAIGDGPPVGRVTDVPWDAALAGHLRSVGTTVSEERVAPVLLTELPTSR